MANYRRRTGIQARRQLRNRRVLIIAGAALLVGVALLLILLPRGGRPDRAVTNVVEPTAAPEIPEDALVEFASPEPTPEPTAAPAQSGAVADAARAATRPTAAPVDPDPGYSYRFSFTVHWLGDREDSIQWTLYNGDGVPVSKKFNKRVINENEWRYETWFSYDASDYYLVETVPDGYTVRYENTGDHALETDRCYSGGAITNYKLPKTGDAMPLELTIGWILVGVSAITFALVKKRRKDNA